MAALPHAAAAEGFDEPPLSAAQHEASLHGFKSRLDAMMLRSARVFLALVMLGAVLQIIGTLNAPELTWALRLSRSGPAALVLTICMIALLLALRWGVRLAAGFFSTAV